MKQSKCHKLTGWLITPTAQSSLCLSFCSDTLGKSLFISLQPPAAGTWNRAIFLWTSVLESAGHCSKKANHLSCIITHEGSLKSAEQSEASHKCKTSPRNTKIIMRSEKTYLTRSWLHFKMTPSRTRRHHVSQGSPDTLHSFVLHPVFNWMLILQKKVQHNNKDRVWIFWEVFQPRGCHSTKHVLNKTCNVLSV